MNTPLSLFAQESSQKQISLADVELLLDKQQKEFNKKVSIYGASALGGLLVGGGIYAYYMQKQINILKKRSLTLSYKVSKAQRTADEIFRSANSMNKKIAKNAKLVKENKAYIDELVRHVEEIVGAVNSHTQVLESIAEEAAEEAAEQANRRPIGFRTTKAAEEAASNLTKEAKFIKKFKIKGGFTGLFVGGLIAMGYVLYNSEELANESKIASKRVEFKRYLEDSYKNDEGLFIFDVISLAQNDRRLTAAILHENIGTEEDYYARLLKQEAEVRQAAVEYEQQNADQTKALMLEQVKPEGEEIANFIGKMNINWAAL